MEFCEQQDLFISGEGGYVRYRIPAILVSKRGTVLAFCEARKYTGKDTDQIDLFLKRSFDNGRSFEDVQIIATQDAWVCGNPAPVVDTATGTIWMLFCKNRQDGDEAMICEGKAPRTVWATSSGDDGASWAEPVEITSAIKRPEWSWYATGPCHGIQLQSGRMVIPCDHIVLKNRNRKDPYHSHIVFSDDHGSSWHVGGIADEGTNESTVLEAGDGRVYLNCRNKEKLLEGGNFRAVTWSENGGESFSPVQHDGALPEPICQASVCRLSGAPDRSRVLFSNPGTREGRHSMTVRLSYDECRTWPVGRVLHQDAAAYSDLAVSHDGTILCLYERGTGDFPYSTISLARFNLEWLTAGQDRLADQG